jgi:hypothetical protein
MKYFQAGMFIICFVMAASVDTRSSTKELVAV